MADPLSLRPAQLPLALYIHIPWCLRKCPYCDFNSHEGGAELPEAAYLQALLDDLEADAPLAAGRALGSIFIGGGTPSLLSADFYRRLLAAVNERVPLSAAAEVTLEANPGTFEQRRFADFRAAGINRLSLGIQSFDDASLKALGRIHNGADARLALEQALPLGFDSVNLDLMHGLPGQSLAGALADLEQALSFAPPHLSWYQLTIEPNTAFHHRPPPLPEDDTLWAIQEQGQALLDAQGMAQYEISAYARAGFQCRHNLNYWQFGDYLGIGAGAHAKLTLADGGVERRSKQRQPKRYLAGPPQSSIQRVAGEELALEFLMNALRLNAGVDAGLFAQRTGLSLAQIAEPLATARARGLLEPDPARLAPTELGRRFLNELLGLFYVD